jgi:hypothetical protein
VESEVEELGEKLQDAYARQEKAARENEKLLHELSSLTARYTVRV